MQLLVASASKSSLVERLLRPFSKVHPGEGVVAVLMLSIVLFDTIERIHRSDGGDRRVTDPVNAVFVGIWLVIAFAIAHRHRQISTETSTSVARPVSIAQTPAGAVA